MKVSILTNEFPPNVYGGAGVHVEYLTRELAKLVDVDVRCFGDQNSDEKSLSARGYKQWNELKGDKPFLKALGPCSIGLSWIKDFPEDTELLHCHTWYSMLGGYFGRIVHNVPLVVTTHSLEPLRPWKAEQLGDGGYRLSSWIEKTAVESADAVIAVSNETREDILRVYPGVDENRIRKIYNGIDLSEYSVTESTAAREKHGVALDKPYVLFVGRIKRQKGIIHLVKAIPHISKDAQVVLCAGAPDTKEIAEEMKRSVEEVKKVFPNVIWIEKMLPKNEVIELYSNAAVFCCPSIYEPFGIINLEAMACNTAVVASAVGGIKEVVVPEETGLLVPFTPKDNLTNEPVDPEGFSKELAGGINRVLADPNMARKMGENGRKRAEELFSWEAIARQTVDLYSELIERNKK